MFLPPLSPHPLPSPSSPLLSLLSLSSLPSPPSLPLSLQCGLLCEHKSTIPARLLHPPAAGKLLKLLVMCMDKTTQIMQPVFTPGLADLRCVGASTHPHSDVGTCILVRSFNTLCNVIHK